MKSLSTLCSLSLILGCGGGLNDAPVLHPTEGTVTYNGDPVSDAQVILIADEGGSVAIANSDSAGAFRLATKGKDGAVAGTHKVRVVALDAAPSGAMPAEGSEEYEKMMSGDAPAPKSRVPEKFGLAETSGLTVSITEGDNVMTLELKD